MQKTILLLPLTLLTLSATAQQKYMPDYKRVVKKHWSAATKNILQQQTAHNKTTAARQRLTARALYAFDGSAMQLNDSANYIYSSDRGSVFNHTDMFYNDYEGSTEMQFDSSAHYRLSGPDFGLTDGSKISYNSSNVRQSYTTLSSTPPGSPLKEITDNRYTYNSNGTLNTTYSLQLNGSVWDTAGKTTYSYNAQNKVAEEVVYNKIITGWEEAFKTTYTYDGAGNNTEVMGYEWTGSAWAENWKDSNTYNANNKLSTNTYMEYTGGVWENVYADSFGYSSTDYYTYNMSKEWNTDSVKWLYASLEERHVGANGLPDSVYYSQWDEDTQDWMRIMISDWHYNSNDLPTNANGIISFMGAELPVFQFNYYYEYYFDAGVDKRARTTAAIYPNPATDKVTIEWKDKTADRTTLYVFNNMGQMVAQQNIGATNKAEISLTGMQPGVYWLKAIAADGTNVLAQQVIKQ
jgi:hypothetical protein